MKYFLTLFIIFTFPLFAVVDRSACLPSGDFLSTGDTSSGTKTFKKICLPNDREDGTNTVIGLPNANIKGGLIQIGNQVLCAMDNSVSTSECIDPNSKEYFDANNQTDGCADSGSNDGCQNNDFAGGPDSAYLGLADYDDNVAYGIDAVQAATTTNSTMASLVLNPGDTVIWAKLYWMGRTATDTDADYNNVKDIKFMTPTTGGLYQDVECTHYGDTGNEYYCSAEVTQLISQSGEYWVGNVTGRQFASNNFTAWSLSIVFQNDTAPFTNVAIYEGFNSFYSGGLNIPLDGFLTPVVGDVNATFHVFAGESDNGYNDDLHIEDSLGNPRLVVNPVGPDDDFLNATIASNGSLSTNRLPNFANALGIDIDSVYTNWNNSGVIEPILDNNQSSTSVNFWSYGDELFIPVVGFTTEIYQPNICYDYSYFQNNRAFTEDNNGSLNVVPHIVGDNISTNDPIQIRILIKNLEPDSYASNVSIHVNDLNSTGDIRYTGNLERTDPGGLAYYAISPISSSDSNVHYYLTDSSVSMGTQQAVYSQFDVSPSSTSINVPLNMSLDFSIALSGGVTLDYSGLNLKNDIPLCTTDNFNYNPDWGIYNVVDSDLYATQTKFNLFTQVAGRQFTNIDLVSHDPTNINTEISTVDVVAIEMIDAGGFHDTNASCYDPGSSITPLVVVPIGNYDASGNLIVGDENATSVNIDLDLAVARGFITNEQKDQFFNIARENIAFRVWFLRGDSDRGLVWTQNDGLESTDAGIIQIRENGSDCFNECPYGNSLNVTDCFRCLRATFGVPVCSRDNFSIRPEAFNVKIYDRDLTSGVSNLVPNTVGIDANISAGYSYQYDINGTNHLNDNATPGYTQNFLTGTDSNISYEWEPNGHVITGCNDLTDDDINGSLKDGSVINLSGINKNVGRYTLKMIDRGWTTVDKNPSHHIGAYFLSGNDCDIDQHAVPIYDGNADYSINMVGCDTQSSHTNLNTGTQYKDYNLSVRPYAYNVDAIQFHRGLIDSNTLVTANNAYIYNSNLATNTDINMSIRYTGRLRAVGADNVSLSNFVKNCYSQTLNLDVNTSLIPVDGPDYAFNLRERYDDNTSIGNVAANTLNNNANGIDYKIIGMIQFPGDNFYKTMQGEAKIELNLNLSRNTNIAFNPIVLTYNDFNVSCQTKRNCQSMADQELIHHPDGVVNSNINIVHIYGREHIPRHRSTTLATTVPIYYEFYCDSSTTALPAACTIGNFNIIPSPVNPISPNALLSPDSVRWYRQVQHNTLLDGTVTTVRTRGNLEDNAFTPDTLVNMDVNTTNTGINFLYNGSKGFPYKVTIETPTPDWLIYNRYDNSPTINNGGINVNSFELEFSQVGGQTGKDNSTTHMNATGAPATNRRIQW